MSNHKLFGSFISVNFVAENDTPPAEQPVQPTKKKKRQFGLATLLSVVVVVAAAAFVLGTRSQSILVWLSDSQNKDLATNLDFSSVQQVYDKLRQQFDGKLDTQKLIDGAKKGLVNAAGDPYTVYFTDDEAKQFMDTLDGKFSGIGAELDKKDNNLVIVSTIDDSPARKAGLQAGDFIAKVNGQDTSDWSIDKAVSQIRGEKGTTVKLTIVRKQTVKEFSIVRDQIINPSVRYEVTADNIGYLRISRFADTDTTKLAQQAAAEFKKKGVRGVVLDVRGNGGGYLTAAQDIASLWLGDKKIVVEERRGDQVTERLYARGDSPLAGIPTVVLIDSGSASASEIVAGALHDHKAAQLVGAKSFGKGSVQQILEILSGGQLKVTIAKWFTPGGVNISKEGIQPDVKVEPSADDIAAGKDVQKDKAFELLKK
jgi:carboxyl-terminal processing protease